MRSEALKTVLLVLMLLLMSVYFFKNTFKLEKLVDDWVDISAGSAPLSKVQIEIAGVVVKKQSLVNMGIFDETGRYQLSLIRLPAPVFQRLKDNMAESYIHAEGVKAVVSAVDSGNYFFSIINNRKFFIINEFDIETLGAVIWYENVRGKTITQCQPQELCRTVRLVSGEWGEVEGPFLNTEIQPISRGMPKGRWVSWPTNHVKIFSSQAQSLMMLIQILAVAQDQKVDFDGSMVEAKRLNIDAKPFAAGGNTLYPQVYLLQVELLQGENDLTINYSKVLQLGNTGEFPMAGYMTSIKIKEGGI